MMTWVHPRYIALLAIILLLVTTYMSSTQNSFRHSIVQYGLYRPTTNHTRTAADVKQEGDDKDVLLNIEDGHGPAVSDTAVNSKKVKLILAYTTIYGNPIPQWRYFHRPFGKCSHKCQWTTDKLDYNKSDAVVFHLYNFVMPGHHRVGHGYREFVVNDLPKRYSEDQKWILIGREPSAFFYPQQLKLLDDMFNLSMTYQLDSDITIPYGRTMPLSAGEKAKGSWKFKQMKIKKKNVVWMVSNCKTSSRREDYVKELQKYITVDIFGHCNGKRDDDHSKKKSGKKYNFYLAFENSDCDDYVTEKFWQSLQVGLIPIVRGRRVNYTKLAPPNSFIHADEFESPKHLAQTLKAISSNRTLFLQYHQWRRSFQARSSLQMICELCEQVHTASRKSLDVYEHFSEDKRCYTSDRNRDRTGEAMKDIEHFTPLPV